MRWQEKYKIVGIKPGTIVHSKYGELDLSNPDISIEIIKDIYQGGCPYLKEIKLKKSDKNS